MPSSKENKIIDVVAKLIKLTQEKKIMWRTQSLNEFKLINPDIITNTVYIANYKDRIIRLYKNTRKINKSLMPSGVIMEYSLSADDYYKSICFEMLDSQNSVLWNVENINTLNDLYDAVQIQVSKIDDFFDEILKEEGLKIKGIIEAKFGSIKTENDVIEYVKHRLNKGKLYFKVSNSTFGGKDKDPDRGTKKVFKIKYKLDNNIINEDLYEEGQTVDLP